MPRLSDAAELGAESDFARLSIEEVAEKIVADCDGDPRAAIKELITMIRALLEENKALSAAALPGYARRTPRR